MSFSVGLVGAVIVSIVASLQAIGRVAGFLLPARLLLLGLQAAADMIRSGLFESRSLAMLADYGFEEVIFTRLAGREHGDDFAVEGGEGRCGRGGIDGSIFDLCVFVSIFNARGSMSRELYHLPSSWWTPWMSSSP